MKRMKRRLMGIFLVLVMIFTMIPDNVLTVSATEGAEIIDEPQEGVQEGDLSETRLSEVILEQENEETENGDSADVTRIEWLAALVETFNMSVEEDNYPDNYFFDLSSADEEYRVAMIATEFGLVDVPAGGELCPNDVATREFVAHSLNLCLGYKPESAEYSFEEVNDVIYPNDIQVAVEKEWFEIVDGRFLPQQALKSKEKASLLSMATTVCESTVIDENYQSVWELADGVIDLTPSVNAELTNDNEFTLTNCQIDLKAGDIFAMHIDGLPLVKQVESLSKEGTTYVIKTLDVENEKAFNDIDIEKSQRTDLTKAVQVAQDVRFEYIVGGTEEEAWQDGEICTDLTAVNGKNVNAINIIKSYDISPQVRKEFELDAGVKAEITCTVSDLVTDYSIKKLKGEAYINADAIVTFSCNVSVDVLEAIGAPASIELARIPLAYGIGYFNVELELSFEGNVTLTMVQYVSAGLQFSDGTFRVTTNFAKKSFTIVARVEASVGIKVAIGFNCIEILKGEVYARIGATAAIEAAFYDDGETPLNCTHVSAWMYTKIGAEASINLLLYKIEWSTEKVIYDENNSPVRVAFHFEDGKAVNRCTREDSESGKNSNTRDDRWRYYTPADSRYGSNGSSSGTGSDGQPYTVFEYELNNYEEATITSYKGNVSALNIPDTLDGYKVIGIGANAFYDNDNLISVTIPDSVVTIKGYAFMGCNNLVYVDLSNNLELLGNQAFGDCTSLVEIEIPKTLKEIDFAFVAGPFEGCISLKKAVFENGTTTIMPYLFYKCSELEEVIIPDSVTEVGWCSFYMCESLKEITLPDGIVEIGDLAFEACVSLENVKLPANLMILGDSAFANCTSLSAIVIPKKLTTAGVIALGEGASFEGCSSLKKVTFEEGITTIPMNLFACCTGLEEVVLPETVTGIDSGAFYDCKKLKKIYLPDSIVSIGSMTFYNCASLENVQLPANLKNLNDLSFAYCTSLKSIIIPKTLETAGIVGATSSSTFYDCTNLKTVVFEEGTTNIVAHLFADCPGVETVVIPDSVTTIETNAFLNCINLVAIDIPDNVTTIGYRSFAGCSKLSKVKMSGKISLIDENAFSGCELIEEIEMPSTLEEIGSYAFAGCEKLKKITFAENAKLNRIGSHAFYDCAVLDNVELPDSVHYISEYAFSKCKELKNIRLSNALESIGFNTFDYCISLEKIVIPYRVKEIRGEVFANCPELKSIQIPIATTSIAKNAFNYPDRMTIYGTAGTYAEAYANENDFKFEEITVPATGIQFWNAPEKLYVSGSYEILHTIEPYDFTDEIVWRSENEDIATVKDGIVKGVGSGTVVITAFAGDTGEVKTSCEIEVIQPVTYLKIEEYSLSLEGGEQYALTLSVFPENATDKTVTWESSDESVVTVTEEGVVTAVGKGTADIIVTANDGYGESDTCPVTVNSTPHLVQSVENLQSEHPYSNNMKDIWIYSLTGAEKIKVNFSSETLVDVGYDYIYVYDKTNNEIGKYTGTELAGKSIELDGDTVKIKLVTDGAITAYGFKVDSVVNIGKPVALKSISLNKSMVRMEKGVTDKLEVIYNPENTTVDRTVTWNSSNEKVVVVGGDGTLTALSAGIATITANVNGKKAECEVIVWQGVESVSVDKAEIVLHLGETKSINFALLPKEATVMKADVEFHNFVGQDVVETNLINALNKVEITGKNVGKAEVIITMDDKSAICTVIVDDRITLDYQNENSTTEQISVRYGEALSILAEKEIAREGYIFAGWYTEPNGKGAKVTAETLVTNQRILYAFWMKTTGDFMVMPVGDQIYTGKAIKPAIRVYDGGTLLEEKEDYTISYKNNTKANDASDIKNAPAIIVKGKNNYKGSVVINFKILPQDITENAFAAEDITLKYNAKKVQNATPVLIWSGKKLKAKTDYTVLYPDSSEGAYKNPGIYDVIIVGKGNFAGERKVTISITQAKMISKLKFAKISNQEYTGGYITPDIKVTDGKKVLTQNIDYVVSYENNREIGTATAIIVGREAYCGTKRVTFKIVGTAISKAKVSGIGAKTYDGSAKTQDLQITLNGKNLVEGRDYVVTYSQNINVGTASMVIKGNGVYSGTIKKKFKITANDLTVNLADYIFKIDGKEIKGTEFASNRLTSIYTKGGSKPVVEVYSVKAGKWLKVGKDYTLSYSANNAITTSVTKKLPTLVLNGKGNYKGKLSKTFTIVAGNISDIHVIVPDKVSSAKAGAYVSKPIFTDSDGKVLKEGKDYTLNSYMAVYPDNTSEVLNKKSVVSQVGTEIVIAVSAKGDYTGETEVSYFITAKSFKGVKVSKISKDYTGKEIILSANDFKNEDGGSKLTIKDGKTQKQLVYGQDFEIVEGTYKNNLKKGTATVTIKGCGEYGGTMQLKFTIGQKLFVER